MTITKRRLASLALAAAAMPPALRRPAAQTTSTIVFWNNWDGSRRAQLRQVLDTFESRNPGVKVESVTLSGDTTAQRMLTAVASGQVPDLYMTQASDFPRWASLGAFQPLDEFARRDGLDLDATFFGSSIQGSRHNGQLIQLPFKVATSLMVWYNKRLFERAGLDPDRPPRTWQELEDVSRRTTESSGDAVSQLGFNVCLNCSTGAGSENPFIEYLSRNDGQVLSADAREVAFESDAGLDTLRWMVAFAQRTSGNWSNAVRAFGTTWRDMRPGFYSGKMAMIADGPFLLNIIANDAPHMMNDVGVFLTPYNGANPRARQRYVAYGVPGYAIPRRARNPELAWRLLRFIAAEQDGACQFFTMQRRADTPLKACQVELPPAIASVFRANAELVEGHAAPGTFQQIHVRIQQMQEAALLGRQTPDAALKAAADDVRRILARSG